MLTIPRTDELKLLATKVVMKNNHFYSVYIFEKFKLKENLATTNNIHPLLKVQTGEKRRPKPHKIRFVSGLFEVAYNLIMRV